MLLCAIRVEALKSGRSMLRVFEAPCFHLACRKTFCVHVLLSSCLPYCADSFYSVPELSDS